MSIETQRRHEWRTSRNLCRGLCLVVLTAQALAVYILWSLPTTTKAGSPDTPRL